MKSQFFVRQKDVSVYQPANHSGTFNKRLISPDTVGAKQLEVLVGHMQPGEGASRHRHPGIEQVCYVLEGRALAEVDGETSELGPGDCCFFPADTPHTFTIVGEVPAKILVIYSPPYMESPDQAELA